jgi:hypothetical protein
MFAQQLSVIAAGPPVAAGNSLLLLARDGSLLSFDKTQGVDLTGPVVTMAYPTAGAQITGKDLQLIFNIADETSGVDAKTISIKVNGQPVDFTYGTDGVAVVEYSDNAPKNKTLQDGRASISISAKDYMGNETVENFALQIDNSLRPLARPTRGPGASPSPGSGGGRGGRGGGGD